MQDPYQCGNYLFPDGHPCREMFFIKTNLRCRDPIEHQYYTSAMYTKDWPRICAWCGSERDIVDPPASVKEKYITVDDMCEPCQTERLRHRDTKADCGYFGITGNKKSAQRQTNKRRLPDTPDAGE